MDSRRTPGGSMRIRGEYKRNPWTPQGIHRIHGHAPKGSSWNPWNPCGFHEDSAEWVESMRNRWGSVNCCSLETHSYWLSAFWICLLFCLAVGMVAGFLRAGFAGADVA